MLIGPSLDLQSVASNSKIGNHNDKSQISNAKSQFTSLLPAAGVRPRLMKLAEEDLEELVMELVKAVVGPL